MSNEWQRVDVEEPSTLIVEWPYEHLHFVGVKAVLVADEAGAWRATPNLASFSAHFVGPSGQEITVPLEPWPSSGKGEQ